MAEKQATTQQRQVAASNDIGEQIIRRISELSNSGLVMPKDFSFATAIKMTMIRISELKDKNGKSALEVCTKESIANSLLKMCLQGLNCGLNQCYPIVRGNQLCIDPSYFGKVLMVKRIYPNWEPKPHVIRKDDEFELAIDNETGLTRLIKHKTSLENFDKDFIGAYIYIPTATGDLDLYVMTAKQIKSAWAKSSSTTQATHKAFDEKMIGKTIINSACNMIINSTPSTYADDSYDHHQFVTDAAEYEVLEEEEEKPAIDAPKEQPEAPKNPPAEEPKPAPAAQRPPQAANGEVPFPQDEF